MNIIQKAAEYAKQKHAGQKRKDGKDYFTHVEAVADIVDKEWNRLVSEEARQVWNDVKDDVVAAAYLHDTFEDCGVTKQDLLDEGFSRTTAEIVDAVSKEDGENYFDFIMRLQYSSFRVGVFAVKLADLEHNMSDLQEGSQKDKYRFAHYFLKSYNH